MNGLRREKTRHMHLNGKCVYSEAGKTEKLKLVMN